MALYDFYNSFFCPQTKGHFFLKIPYIKSKNKTHTASKDIRSVNLGLLDVSVLLMKDYFSYFSY